MLLFNGYRVSVFQEEKVLEFCCKTNVHIVNTTVHLKIVKMVNFMLCVFYIIKKREWGDRSVKRRQCEKRQRLE